MIAKEVKLPEYLYHYTNISTLGMILSSKKLRLNRLDKLDDLEESEFGNLNHISRYTFVSSWTDDESESIPLWNMYTDDMRGIRIKMTANPFKMHKIFKHKKITSSVSEDGSIKLDITYDTECFENFIMQKDWDSRDYLCAEINEDNHNGDNILEKVIYSNDENLLNPKGYEEIKAGGKISYSYNLNIGKCKRDVWKFQNEWRYILRFFPFANSILNIPAPNRFLLLDKKIELAFSEYYLEFEDIAFEQMEIMLGPKVTDGDVLIVKDLVEKYNEKSKVIYSKLYGKIR